MNGLPVPRNASWICAVVVLAGLTTAACSANMGAAGPTAAPAHVRALDPAEAKLVIRGLMAQSAAEISKDPSCQADLASAKAMTLNDAMTETLVRTATGGKLIALRAECFVRRDYPLNAGEEYCRIAWVPATAPQSDEGYGLLFIMNWQTKRVSPQSIECY